MIRERTEGPGPRPAARPEPPPTPEPRPRARSAWSGAVGVARDHPVLVAAGVLLLGFCIAALAARRRSG